MATDEASPVPAREEAVPDTISLRVPLTAWATTRGILFVFAWVILSVSRGPLADLGRQALADQPWIDGWTRWDAWWYWTIARDGYSWIEGVETNLAFFPLYPYLVRVLSLPLVPIIGDPLAYFTAAVGTSLASSLAAAIGMYRLAVLKLGESAAGRAVWLMCLFPYAYFFSAAYPTALFAALAIWTFVFVERRSWGSAFSLAALCSIARPNGILIGVVVIIAFVLATREADGPLYKDALHALWIPAMFGGFLMYQWFEFGSPWRSAQAQDAWGGQLLVTPLEQIQRVLAGDFNPGWTALYLFQIAVALAAIPLVVVAWRRLGSIYGLLSALGLASAVALGFYSSGRRVAVVFPLFLALAAVTHRRPLFFAVAVSFGLLQIILAQLFIIWAPAF